MTKDEVTILGWDPSSSSLSSFSFVLGDAMGGGEFMADDLKLKRNEANELGIKSLQTR